MCIRDRHQAEGRAQRVDQLLQRPGCHRPGQKGRQLIQQILHRYGQKRCQADSQHRQHPEHAHGAFQHPRTGQHRPGGIGDDRPHHRHGGGDRGACHLHGDVYKRQSQERLDSLAQKRVLTDPAALIADKGMQLDHLQHRLAAAMRAVTDRESGRFAALAASLDALSPLRVLGRGYALAQTEDGTCLLYTSRGVFASAVLIRDELS